MKRFFTRNGVEVQPYKVMPLTSRCAIPMATRIIEQGRAYRLCQMLPAIPQRFEWINEKNLIVKEEGQERPGFACAS